MTPNSGRNAPRSLPDRSSSIGCRSRSPNCSRNRARSSGGGEPCCPTVIDAQHGGTTVVRAASPAPAPSLRAGCPLPFRVDQGRGGVELLGVAESELFWSVHPDAVLSLLWQSVVRSLSASPVPVLDVLEPLLLPVLVPVLVPVLELLLVPVEPASARRLIPELPSSFEPMSEHAPRAVKAKATAIAIEFRVFISHLVDRDIWIAGANTLPQSLDQRSVYRCRKHRRDQTDRVASSAPAYRG
jgi:hypothetical protein